MHEATTKTSTENMSTENMSTEKTTTDKMKAILLDNYNKAHSRLTDVHTRTHGRIVEIAERAQTSLRDSTARGRERIDEVLGEWSLADLLAKLRPNAAEEAPPLATRAEHDELLRKVDELAARLDVIEQKGPARKSDLSKLVHRVTALERGAARPKKDKEEPEAAEGQL